MLPSPLSVWRRTDPPSFQPLVIPAIDARGDDAVAYSVLPKELSDDYRRTGPGIRTGSQDDETRAGARAVGQAGLGAAHEIDDARPPRHAPRLGAGGDLDLADRRPLRIQGRSDAAADVHRPDRRRPRQWRRQ